MGEPPPILFVSCFCRGVQHPEPARPAQRFQHALAQFRLKKASSVGAVCGNNSSFTNKADLSATDGINSEYKQEPHQSPKDARPARRGGQPTSRRRVRNITGKHGRDGGTPSHQPPLDKGIKVAHQTDTTLAGSATGPRSP